MGDSEFDSAFEDLSDRIRLCGRVAKTPNHGKGFLKGKVAKRVRENRQAVDARTYVRDLAATTGFAVPAGVVPVAQAKARPDWEVGEDVGRVLLEEFEQAYFPWSADWDKRVDSASLPGPDIVGLHSCSGAPALLFGEIKTSTEADAPPRGVIDGQDGLRSQLLRLLVDANRRWTLVEWLVARATGKEWQAWLEAALISYVRDGRAEVMGVLMRDTDPNLDDVRSTRAGLVGKQGSFQVAVLAFYMRVPIPDWGTHVGV